MSSPMYDMPEHFPMPLNKFGQGPADRIDTVRMVCSCGDERCEKYKPQKSQKPQPTLPSPARDFECGCAPDGSHLCRQHQFTRWLRKKFGR